jgi:hypothetical protein
MYTVFWIEAGAPRAEPFGSGALGDALVFAESLRRRRRDGEAITFVTLASEDPHSVGPSGVADPEPGYAWVKRRPPPKRGGR